MQRKAERSKQPIEARPDEVRARTGQTWPPMSWVEVNVEGVSSRARAHLVLLPPDGIILDSSDLPLSTEREIKPYIALRTLYQPPT